VYHALAGLSIALQHITQGYALGNHISPLWGSIAVIDTQARNKRLPRG